MLSADECEKKVWKKFIKDGLSLTNKKKIEVQVSILNTDWLLHHKTNFMEFSQNLSKTKNTRIYQTDLIKTLVEEFWD